ncbi:MAG TPA: carboxy terminal-processing peptidase [Candidatus Sulfotelmatobacter sp.]|nr:carboxy terminal-processing peptidase [Candidatus Sulfotelmatobacter sp.]
MMFHKKVFSAATAVIVAAAIWTGCQSARSVQTSGVDATATATDDLKPGPNDPQIAFIAVRLLENYHYLHHPLDREMSEKIYDGYINDLDREHEAFLQSDLDEFAPLRTNLDMLLLGNHGASELRPAFAIYERYTERVRQQTDYVNELLRDDKFRFNTEDKYIYDRRHEPFPKDLDAAKQLWRQQLRFEYLQLKLALELHDTNGTYAVKLPADAATNITADLTKRYHSILRMATNSSSDDVLTRFLDSGLAHAYDPHTDYYSAPKAQDFSIEMNLALIGVGAQLVEDDGYCTVVELVPGGPAMKSKLLKPYDRIVAVAQDNKPPVDVINMELERIVQMIRGQKGTEVRLTVSPVEDRNARRVVTLVRDEIKLEDKQAKASMIEYPNGQRIGIIDLPSFYAPIGDGTQATKTTPKYTSVDVAALLKKLKQEKVSGVILDLRSNPGGSLEEAIKFTGLFIKEGPVVQQRDSSTGRATADSIPEPGPVYEGPLMVMVNRFSASASEIAAAALQDYGRAIIVGDTSTHGKGTVQQLQPLRPFVWPATASATNDPGILKITKGKFYRISGGSTQMKGVASDIVLPDIWNYSTLVGESALDNAMEWDTIAPCDYDKLNLVQPFLPELERRSLDRVATNQDFTYIRQDIEEFVKKQAENSGTLNEHAAIAEHQGDNQKNHERDKERDARPLPAEKLSNITLDADTGLPSSPELEPFFTTNYNTSTTTDPKFQFSKDLTAQFSSPSATNTVVFTNFFDSSVVADFEQYYRSNYPATTIISTSSQTTNYIAEISSGNGTNQLFEPVISKSVSHDPTLEESENIMRDYISLLSKSGMLTTTR